MYNRTSAASVEEYIKKAIELVGTKKLRDIKDVVNKNITYFQIQTCILLMRKK